MGFHPGRRAYPISTNTSNSISNKKGWMVGTNARYGIGIPYNVNRFVSQKTTPYNYQNGELKDDRNLVVQQNTLSGVGKMRSQFLSDSDGITSVRYYLNEPPSSLPPELPFLLSNNWGKLFLNDAPNPNADDPNNYTVLNNAGITNINQLLPFDSDWAIKSASVTDMNTIFKGCTDLSNTTGIVDWDTALVTDMKEMFNGANNFNENIGGWDVGSVENMYAMFVFATSFNQNISGWNTSSVTDMTAMFQFAIVFNQNISGWNTSSVSNMDFMFQAATAFDQNISGWNLSSISTAANMQSMFNGAFSTSVNGVWLGTSNFKTKLDAIAPVIAFFSDGSNYTVGSTGKFPQLNFDASILSNNWGKLFLNNIPNSGADDPNNYADLSNAGITDINQLLPFNGTWTTKSASVTDMNTMFKGCTNLSTTNGLSTWNPALVTDMGEMFNGANNFNEDIGGWDVGSVENMYAMLVNNSSFNQDISGWNVSSVTDMQFMFQSNTVFDQDLSDWAVHLVAPTPTISFMFFFAAAFNGGGTGVGSANSVATRATWINTAGGPYTSAELNAAMIYGP